MKIASALVVVLLGLPHAAPAASPQRVDQGTDWTPAAQQEFYSRDQGSRIMPLGWMAALKQPNGDPFLAESLGRYGYLPNEESVPAGLAVGFTVSGGSSGQMIGMTCAACHTRQIEVAGVAYRIDGGPAIADFQSFLADLDVAVAAVLADQGVFANFGLAVLGPNPSPDKLAELKDAVKAWHLRYHTLMQRALPSPAWGPSRLDAVSMIFNRLTGLDIGPPPTYLIPGNIQVADAPVRYPFLWNAAKQDRTQWPGFADNGNDILGLARNVGEVIGVFADFHPKKDRATLLGVNYVDDNSASFRGLHALEESIRKIGKPKWPWAIDKALAAEGRTIFQNTCSANCHERKIGQPRSLDSITWATPVQDVGTDSRQVRNILPRMVDTGVLSGALIPFAPRLLPKDTAFNVLRTAVAGSILQHYLPVVAPRLPFALPLGDPLALDGTQLLFAPGTEFLKDLKGAFREPAGASGGPYAYESRVLEGIWAAAPYLHNGSVPTLAELLKPVGERTPSFRIGPAYDPDTVGLAVDQTRFSYTLTTTDCGDRNSGNSRCGHTFGTTLTPGEKKALLEYLKSL
jgi:cytochrome c5